MPRGAYVLGGVRRRSLRLPARMAVVVGVFAASLLGTPTAAPAATTPSGFQETVVFSGLINPTAVRFASDGRVFVAEKRGIIKVFDSLSGHDADDLRGSPDERLQLLGSRPARSRAAPELSAESVRLRPLRLRRRHRRAGAQVGCARRRRRSLPGHQGREDVRCDRQRLRRERPPLPSPGEREHDGRQRAGADQRLVPAVSEPLDRESGVRCRRRPVRQRGRRSELPLRRLRSGRRARQPVRRPARRCRSDADASDRGGRRPQGPGPSHKWRSRWTRRSHSPRRPGDGCRAPDQPARRKLRPERAPHHCLRAQESISHHDATGNERGLDRGRRLERLGGDRPHPEPNRRGRRELRLAVLRGAAASTGVRLERPRHLRKPLRAVRSPRAAVLPVSPQQPGRR